MNTNSSIRYLFACGGLSSGAILLLACASSEASDPVQGPDVQEDGGGEVAKSEEDAANGSDAGNTQNGDEGDAALPESCVGAMNTLPEGIGPHDVIAAAQSVQGAWTTTLGANDWSCRSKPAVVLVHGGGGNMRDGFGFLSFAQLAPRIKSAGYCVFIPDYDTSLTLEYHAPDYTKLGALRTAPTTALLEVFIEGVLLATGQEKIDLLAHSLGGGAIRSTIRGGNLAPKINALISVDCPAHVSFKDAPLENPKNCPACAQVWGFDDGAFWKGVNGADDRCSVLPGISYTSFALAGTSYDSIPYLDATSGHATNALFYSSCVTKDSAAALDTVACTASGAIDIYATRSYLKTPAFAPRRLCPTSPPQSHIGQLFDATVASAIVAALDAGGRLPTTFEPKCP